MHSDQHSQSLLKAAQEFHVNPEQTISTQRKALEDALGRIRSTSSLKGVDLGALLNELTPEKETSDFSPFDVVVEAQASHRDSLGADLLKKIMNHEPPILKWPDNLYVYVDYKPSLSFPPPPLKNLYAAEMPNQSSLGVASNSSKHTGALTLLAATHSNTLLGNVTVRAGIYILFQATIENIGSLGRVTFSPKVTWETNCLHLALGQIGDKLDPLIINHEKTSARIELTVDRLNAATNQFQPLPYYPAKTYPIDTFVPTYAELSRDENGVFNTGQLEHSFLALRGRTYRLGVVVRLDLSWHITENVARQVAGHMSNFYSGLQATVPSITVQTEGYIRKELPFFTTNSAENQ